MWYPGGYLGTQTEMFGELIARDGTPPLRVILRVRAPKKCRLWTRTKKKNNQHAFRPQDVYISHMMIYALPADKVAPSQAGRQWELRDTNGSLTDASSEGVKIGYPVLVKQEATLPLDVAHKQLPRVRTEWIKPLTTTRWAPGQEWHPRPRPAQVHQPGAGRLAAGPGASQGGRSGSPDPRSANVRQQQHGSQWCAGRRGHGQWKHSH